MNHPKVDIEECLTVKAADVFSIIKDQTWLLLDVRHNFERSSGYLPGLHIPLENLAERSLEIPTDKHILLYCRCGNRSETAIAKLKALGFKNELANLEGGIMAVRRVEAKLGTEVIINSRLI